MSPDLMGGEQDQMPAPKKRAEDVADWEVRMTSGELIRVSKGVIYYGSDRYSIYSPRSGPEGLLFSAPLGEVNRIRRVNDDATTILKDATA